MDDYENMIFAPTPYRVAYPLRLVALASIQDWDVVDFHYGKLRTES